MPQRIQRVKILGKVFASIFFGSRRNPPHWLSSKGPNYQRRVLLISVSVVEGHFEGKTTREIHQGGLVVARQFSVSPDASNLEQTGLPGLLMS